MKKIVVFASGNGSNFESIVNEAGSVYSVSLLICDNPDAYVLKRSERLNVPFAVFNRNQYGSRREMEASICQKIKPLRPDLIALAGYMRLIRHSLLEEYQGKIINIHPSLLPDFPGMKSIERAFSAGAEETGVTIHYIDSGVDTGAVIAQRKVDISGLTLEETEEKIHAAEHQFYPQIVKELLKT